MTLRVHLLRPPAVPLEPLLAPDITLTIGEQPPVPARYQILVAGRPDRDALEASPVLRALIIPFSGVPAPTVALLRDYPDLAVHNLHHNAAATAEMAIALLLAAARQLVPVDREFRAGGWSGQVRRPGIQLTGKTALILGHGAIGRLVARGCSGLRMRVQAVRRAATPTVTGEAVEIHPVAQLDALLPGADALIVCLPATPRTEGLIDATRLALLPEGALVINVGRGTVIDEQALFEALGGRLGGAGLDVWYHYGEGRPSAAAFESLDNVVMSPHRGGTTDQSEASRSRELAALLNRAQAGQPLPDRVDLHAGY